jgi:DNA helicase II / ATP-dependent DNA helicase PcrA
VRPPAAREAPRLGYKPGFTIYDSADSVRLVGMCIKDLGIDPKKVSPRGAAAAISNAKNELVDFDTFALRAENWFDRQVAEVYKAYAGRLQRASAFDFDDLLVKTVELFQLFDDVLDRYRRQFRHVLVDEWQDTNRVQYELVKLLAWEHRNITVVGDDSPVCTASEARTSATSSTSRPTSRTPSASCSSATTGPRRRSCPRPTA